MKHYKYRKISGDGSDSRPIHAAISHVSNPTTKSA